jgi:hypothetical protein
LLPADVCPPPRDLLLVTAKVIYRRLQGDEFDAVDVADGSI